MIKDNLKLLKMAKYGFNSKTSTFIGLVFLVLGLILLCIPSGNNSFLGCMYITLGPMMLLQVTNTNLLTGLVLASPKHKNLELKLPDCLTAIISFTTYTIVVVALLVRIYLLSSGVMTPTAVASAALQMLFSAVLMATMCLYIAVVYKKYLVALIAFISAFVIIFNIGGNTDITIIKPENILPLWQYIGIGYGIVIIGNAIGMLARRILFKAPMSKYTMGAMMRKMK